MTKIFYSQRSAGGHQEKQLKPKTADLLRPLHIHQAQTHILAPIPLTNPFCLFSDHLSCLHYCLNFGLFLDFQG
ncbi:MAG TPA: hypothetical protein VII93_10620, partial [Anaerolineales bacterium]